MLSEHQSVNACESADWVVKKSSSRGFYLLSIDEDHWKKHSLKLLENCFKIEMRSTVIDR